MKLRFKQALLRELSVRYVPSAGEDQLVKMRRSIGAKGCINGDQLFAIARWKSPRSAGRVNNNSESFVRELTSVALASEDERTRVEVLTLLDGVDWPTASVILHFLHKDPYPILDVRALWSLNSKKPNQYNYVFWSQFVQATRALAEKNNIDMRQLDMALWQYSSENQKSL